jgi:hypothetical protein
MWSHRTGTIGIKSGTPIPHLPHFQGFLEQEGKGRGRHTGSLPGKDTTKTWASRGDICSIPLDKYRERACKRRKKPNRSNSKPRGTRTRRQSEKGERIRVPSQPWTRRVDTNTTTNSVSYVDCCRAMGLGCPISQTWTPHRQDNLSVAGATVSSSAARTEKGQEQDRLASYPRRRASVGSRLRPWAGAVGWGGRTRRRPRRQTGRPTRAKTMVHTCCEVQ